ncbi:MAG: hypothetical protein LCH95_05205 [Proteobacteria bacterium]|nr:hypothetical protein [Pseudomonadota bacterium]
MNPLDLTLLHSNLGLAILVLAGVVMLTTFHWGDVARAVRSLAASPARAVDLSVCEGRWSETCYANRVALNLVIRVEVSNRSDAPWSFARASLRGHRALAVSACPLESSAGGGAGTERRPPVIAPGATGIIGIHFILDATPPADPAAAFVASLVLVDRQVGESALRLAARGPKG